MDPTNIVIAGAAVVNVAKYLVFGVAVAAAIICAFDWLVRTRRLNPFGRVARFFRSAIDPMMAPVERRVVRAGGLPSAAPWWSLVTVVVGGILLLALIDTANRLLLRFVVAADQGPRAILVVLIAWAFELLQLALIVRVISSWVRISPYSAWVRWAFVLTEWLLAPLRRIIPPLGMIDITPIIAYIVLQLLENLILHLFG
jgi:YggT family protein